MTAKERARLDQLIRASWALTKPERRRLAALLKKSREERQNEDKETSQ